MNKMTPEQVAALKEFAAENGRGWKRKLQEKWMKASAPPELHALRNSHGPSWLGKVKLEDLT